MDPKSPSEKKKASFGAKLRHVLRNVTVEPVMILFITPSVLASLAVQNLNLEKACRVNLAYPSATCDALSARNTTGFEREEVEVQKLVAWLQMWKAVIQSALPTLVIVFMGAWSDRTRRRKPCILMPLFGELLMGLSLMACTYWFYELSMEFTGLNEGFWPAITGGWFTMLMGVFSYVGDVTDLESRTMRIGIVSGTIYLSIPIGLALSGVLYVELGFYGVFGIAIACYAVGLGYGLFFLKEVPGGEKARAEHQTRGSRWGALVEFFSVKHIGVTVRTTFRKTGNKRHKKLAVLMMIISIIIGQMHGEFW